MTRTLVDLTQEQICRRIATFELDGAPETFIITPTFKIKEDKQGEFLQIKTDLMYDIHMKAYEFGLKNKPESKAFYTGSLTTKYDFAKPDPSEPNTINIPFAFSIQYLKSYTLVE